MKTFNYTLSNLFFFTTLLLFLPWSTGGDGVVAGNNFKGFSPIFYPLGHGNIDSKVLVFQFVVIGLFVFWEHLLTSSSLAKVRSKVVSITIGMIALVVLFPPYETWIRMTGEGKMVFQQFDFILNHNSYIISPLLLLSEIGLLLLISIFVIKYYLKQQPALVLIQ